MKQMGNLANVEIEPESQTQIIDQGIQVPGVLMGSVPGGNID